MNTEIQKSALLVTERELRLLEFATWRFMNDAYKQAIYLHKKKPDVDEEKTKERADKFYKDAKDAEELVGKLRAHLQSVRLGLQ